MRKTQRGELAGLAITSVWLAKPHFNERHKMQIVIKYKLKKGISAEDFHTWVRTTDYPTMRGLDRVKKFRTMKTLKLLMGEGEPSSDYIEIFDIPDMDGFLSEDMPGATVMGVMEQFLGFAEAPEFIIAEEVE